MELVDIPVNTTEKPLLKQVVPTECHFLKDLKVSDVHITDPGTPNWLDVEVRDYSKADTLGSKPVSVIMKISSPAKSIARFTLYPRNMRHAVAHRELSSVVPRKKTPLRSTVPLEPSGDGVEANPPPVRQQPATAPVWKYTLQNCTRVKISDVSRFKSDFCILPGSCRPLILTTSVSSQSTHYPRLDGVYRFHDPEMSVERPGPRLLDQNSRATQRVYEPALANTVLELPFSLPVERLLKAITFDEVSGRLIYMMDGRLKIWAVDIRRYRSKPRAYEGNVNYRRSLSLGLSYGVCSFFRRPFMGTLTFS